MNKIVSLSLCLISGTLVLHSQELPADMASEPTSAPNIPSAPPVPEIVPTPQQQPTEKQESHLPPGEQRIREGIALLASLHDTMAGVSDRASADAAVAPVMRITADLSTWAQGFTALPPMTESEQVACEEYYLPFIRKINSAIKRQGERLAAAEYYGSQQLPAALVRLALLNQ